jgi:hypothetical protein
MSRKLKATILSLVSLILLTSCKTTEYVYSDCLVLPAVIVTNQDKQSLYRYKDEFSHEFIRSLADLKEAREKKCIM